MSVRSLINLLAPYHFPPLRANARRHIEFELIDLKLFILDIKLIQALQEPLLLDLKLFIRSSHKWCECSISSFLSFGL